MPVFNGEKFIRESIESVLEQTYDNFEYIIINDGSIDNSLNVIKSYKDSRIKIINNKINVGITKSLNIALKLSIGDFIARVDVDDISFPERFKDQINYLQLNPRVGACGTQTKYIGSHNSVIIRPLHHDEIKAWLLFRNSISHSTVMFRKSMIFDNNLFYNDQFDYSQDYELWTRAVKSFKLANLPNVYSYYRIHNDQIGNLKNIQQLKYSNNIRLNQLINLGIQPSKNE